MKTKIIGIINKEFNDIVPEWEKGDNNKYYEFKVIVEHMYHQIAIRRIINMNYNNSSCCVCYGKLKRGMIVYKHTEKSIYYCEKCITKKVLIDLNKFDEIVSVLRKKLVDEKELIEKHKKDIDDHNLIVDI